MKTPEISSTEIFFEPAQSVARKHRPIGHDDAHDRDRDESCFMLDDIGYDEPADDKDQQHRRFQIFGNVTTRKEPGDAPAERCPEQSRDKGRADNVEADRGDIGPRSAIGNIGEDEDREQRADRIVDDPLPFQDVGRARTHPQRSQHRPDDGRAGHDQNASEQRRHFPAEPGAVMAGQRAEEPSERYADHHDSHHRPSGLTQFSEIEAQSAFEQDDRHRQLDDGLHQSPEIPFGIYEASAEKFVRDQRADRSDENTDDQHQCDGGAACTPGDPLHPDPGDTDHRDLHHQGVERH